MSHQNSTSSFFKGMGIGAMLGLAAAIGSKMLMCNNHNISKGSSKVVRAVGDFVDGIQTMVR